MENHFQGGEKPADLGRHRVSLWHGPLMTSSQLSVTRTAPWAAATRKTEVPCPGPVLGLYFHPVKDRHLENQVAPCHRNPTLDKHG